MKKLSVKEIKLTGNVYKVSRLEDSEFMLPQYAVILDSNLMIDCQWGQHLFGYAIAATIYFAETLRDEELMPGLRFKNTAGELFNKIESATSKDGLISGDDALKLFSIYSTTIFANGLKENFPDIHKKLTADVTFINAKAQDTKTTKTLKDLAEKWVVSNGKYIWGIRTLIFMLTDRNFWEENNKQEWSNEFRKSLNLTLPSIKILTELQCLTSGEVTYELENNIVRLFSGKDKARIKSVFDQYSEIRRLIEVTPYYGKSWVDNYTSNDLDNLIFSEKFNEGPITKHFKKVIKKNKAIVIVDNEMDTRLELKVADIKKINYSKHRDEIILTFITPSDISLRKDYSKGDLISGYVIDSHSTVTTVK